jgi:hypothetical protein
MIETAAVVILGLRYGFVTYTRLTFNCQIAAVVGLILWQIFNSSGIAVFANVSIDLIGALPTFRHSWQKPFEETWSAYALSGVGGFEALFAIESYN